MNKLKTKKLSMGACDRAGDSQIANLHSCTSARFVQSGWPSGWSRWLWTATSRQLEPDYTGCYEPATPSRWWRTGDEEPSMTSRWWQTGDDGSAIKNRQLQTGDDEPASGAPRTASCSGVMLKILFNTAEACGSSGSLPESGRREHPLLINYETNESRNKIELS